MSGIYHVLAQPPAWYKEDMTVETEELALQLVLMGRLRIDADEQRNFVRFNCPFRDVSLAFSNRELEDPMLTDRTEDILTAAFSEKGRKRNESPREQALQAMDILRTEAKNNFLLTREDELYIARILVQCAEPAVIMLMIAEGVEIFITYGVMVGDLMDIQSWKVVGTSSGLQSADYKNSEIFVSCAGNPLLIPSDENQQTYVSDGYSALARMMTIAAQEIGHYADIIRDLAGHYVARHSSSIDLSMPTTKAKKARKSDIAALKIFKDTMFECNINALAHTEAAVRFYRKHRRYSPFAWPTKLVVRISTWLFKYRCRKFSITPWKCLNEKAFPASQILLMIEDMAFQLEPDAEAYRHPDKNVEEAIACAEALARVPQQVVKWGHPATQLCMGNLYEIYYQEVIPGCKEAYEKITGARYTMSHTKYSTSLMDKIKNIFKKKKPRHTALPYFKD